MATLGERLASLRKEKGLSQTEFAQVFQLGQSTIGMYETNKRLPDATTIGKFADYFNVTIDYLLGRTDVNEIDILDLLEDNNISIKAGDQSLTQEQRLLLLQGLDNDANKDIEDPEILEFMQELNAFFKVDKNLPPNAKREIMQDLTEYFKFKIAQRKKTD